MAHAIIAINENGIGHFMKWLEPEKWVQQMHDEFDILPEIEFKEVPGLYKANMTGSSCCGAYCNCEAKDCFETDWEVEELIFGV